jgi:hypothetical protein
MLQNILEKYYNFPQWVKDCPRFMKLQVHDAWLDGTFYDKIPTPYSQHTGGNGKDIKMFDRRPAVQHNLPKLMANLSARKLFGGRHAPRLRHQNEKFKLAVQAYIEELHLTSRMLEVVKRGSVGSILVLFQLRKLDGRVQTLIEVTKARNVTPKFDAFQELTSLRIHYPTGGRSFKDQGFTTDCEGRLLQNNEKYWFVRDLNKNEDCVYHAIPESMWDPVNGDDQRYMKEAVKVANPLGFLPAVWIQNLPGGEHPDGDCTFASALNNFIEYDYMYSQLGNGLFYHASPTLVVKGGLVQDTNELDDGPQRPVNKDPAYILQLPADEKDAVGGTMSGHDAKLLDTNAQGLTTGIDFCAKLKHASLEQTSMARKDLESISGSMSGKAMELIDQEFLDLIQELRVQYCEYGFLPLLKKLCKAAKMMGHPLLMDYSDTDIDGLSLQYPAAYTPDPQEFLYLVQALALATGLGQKNPEGGVNGAAAPVAPHEGLLTIEEASLYLKTQMDFYMVSEDVPVITETDPVGRIDEPEAPKPDDTIGEGESNIDVTEQYPKGNTPTSVRVKDIPF